MNKGGGNPIITYTTMAVGEKSELAEARKMMDEAHALVRELSDTKLTIAGKEFALSEWLTLTEYAKRHDLTVSRVQQWVIRGIVPEECIVIVPELNYLKLVKDQLYVTRANPRADAFKNFAG